SDEVFKDVSRGVIATRNELSNCYGTDDINAIIKQILKKGTFQMNDKEREEALSGMFKGIASQIALRVVSPTTQKPYPQSIIEKAMKEVHLNVNLSQSIRKQIREAISKIKTVLPFEESMMKICILVENTTEGHSLSQEILKFAHTIVIDEIINENRKIVIKIQPEMLHHLRKMTETDSFRDIPNNITVENFHEV
ncbi:hypothetical protein MXB_1793, partial [Myxobolus squamalis]